MCLRKNNDGISLIELIISMAITAIVLSMIVILINTAAHSFKRTNEDVNLQLEAQVAINQLSTIGMEASMIIECPIANSDDKKYLVSCPSSYYVLYYIHDKNKLYLIKDSIAANVLHVDPIENEDAENQYLMAEYVSEFMIDTTKEGIADIHISFVIGDQTPYEVSKKVKLRNA